MTSSIICCADGALSAARGVICNVPWKCEAVSRGSPRSWLNTQRCRCSHPIVLASSCEQGVAARQLARTGTQVAALIDHRQIEQLSLA